jgi:hypothetical protein
VLVWLAVWLAVWLFPVSSWSAVSSLPSSARLCQRGVLAGCVLF